MNQIQKVNELLPKDPLSLTTNSKSVDMDKSIPYGSVYGERLTKDDLVFILAKMTINFGKDYFSEEGNLYLKCEEIFARCMELNWSSEEFRNRVESFLDTCRWENFTRADFINYDRPMLLTHHDVMEAQKKDPKIWDKIKRYYVEGVVMFGEIRHDFQLPEHDINHYKALPAPTANGHERSKEWDLMGQYLDLKTKYEALEQKNKQLESELKKGSI
jgi:hypothetical protein